MTDFFKLETATAKRKWHDELAKTYPWVEAVQKQLVDLQIHSSVTEEGRLSRQWCLAGSQRTNNPDNNHVQFLPVTKLLMSSTLIKKSWCPLPLWIAVTFKAGTRDDNT